MRGIYPGARSPERRTPGAALVKVDKSYLFDGPGGQQTLADLFAGEASRGPAFHVRARWSEAAKLLVLGGWIRRMVPHLAARDTTLVAISRAPYQAGGIQGADGWTLTGCPRRP